MTNDTIDRLKYYRRKDCAFGRGNTGIGNECPSVGVVLKKKKKIYVAPQLRESHHRHQYRCNTFLHARRYSRGYSNTSTTAIFRWLLMHRRNIGDTLIQGEWEIYQPDHIIFAQPNPRHGVPCPMYSHPLAVFFFECGSNMCPRRALSWHDLWRCRPSRCTFPRTSTLKTFRHPSVVIRQAK